MTQEPFKNWNMTCLKNKGANWLPIRKKETDQNHCLVFKHKVTELYNKSREYLASYNKEEDDDDDHDDDDDVHKWSPCNKHVLQ